MYLDLLSTSTNTTCAQLEDEESRISTSQQTRYPAILVSTAVSRQHVWSSWIKLCLGRPAVPDWPGQSRNGTRPARLLVPRPARFIPGQWSIPEWIFSRVLIRRFCNFIIFYGEKVGETYFEHPGSLVNISIFVGRRPSP